jgi:ADP-dependent NAD(P)H-hydrate dehydratase / NAD(P)H-hydrate epimerase
MIELLTTAEMAEADRLAVAGGIPSIALMENAGRAVADAAAKMLQGRRVVVVAGPGNNGGDGFVAARCLAERGLAVSLCFVGKRERLKGDAALAAQRWTGPVSEPSPGAFAACDLIIDALFGAGLDRDVEGPARGVIDLMNAASVPIVAVDLPSGVSGTTGAVMGRAVNAQRTVTFFRCKPGHVLLPGRLHCGTVEVADIGIPERVLDKIKPTTFANSPTLWRNVFPQARTEGHKYSRGHAVVVSGGPSSTGAARLAARGALRAGAGVVTIASPKDALNINAAENVAVMVRPVDGPIELKEFLADKRRNAIVLGPGGGVGAAMREQVRAALESDAAVVLDADALTSFAGESDILTNAVGRRAGRPVVLTPHEGEFSRLFSGLELEAHSRSKLERARLAAAKSGAVLILKGADSVVAEPGGRAAIANNAPPTLATAGSGDVLAGIVCGLLAQGMPVFEAACAAVWMHGEAAKEFGPGLIAEDLPDMLPRVYGRLFGGPGGRG